MAGVDTITHSVIVNALRSYCSEVSTVLLHTSRNPTLSDGHDFSVGIVNSGLELLTGGAGVPCHLASIDMCVEAMTSAVDDVHHGDILLTNDPYVGLNTHLADFTLVKPVFSAEDEPVLWVVLRAHQSDIGAIDPASMATSAENIYHEGIRIPPVKIVADGSKQTDVIDILTHNSRVETTLSGDLQAMIGAVEKGGALLEELLETYGEETIRASATRLLDATERRASEFVETIPNGRYTGESQSDTNPDTGESVVVRTELTVDDESLSFDFTGTDDQIDGVTNNSLAVTFSAVNGAWFSIANLDFPLNAGAFRMVDVHAPEGTIVNPEFPAGTAYATITSYQETVEACWHAFRAVVPEETPAGYARMVRPNISGESGADGEPYSQLQLNVMGGGGAIRGTDGPQSVAGTVGFRGGTAVDPEIQERRLPLFIHETDLRTDSGGAGRWRGGLGLEFKISPVDHEAVFSVGGDFGQTVPPYGHDGGEPGSVPRVYTESPGGERTEIPHGFVNVSVPADHTYVQKSGGGGGVGDPLERPVEAVQEDVHNGYVSRAAAIDTYGVVFHEGTDEIDHEATRTRRRAR